MVLAARNENSGNKQCFNGSALVDTWGREGRQEGHGPSQWLKVSFSLPQNVLPIKWMSYKTHKKTCKTFLSNPVNGNFKEWDAILSSPLWSLRVPPPLKTAFHPKKSRRARPSHRNLDPVDPSQTLVLVKPGTQNQRVSFLVAPPISRATDLHPKKYPEHGRGSKGLIESSKVMELRRQLKACSVPQQRWIAFFTLTGLKRRCT